MLELANITVDCISLFSVVGDISLPCIIIVQYAILNNNVCIAIHNILFCIKILFQIEREGMHIDVYSAYAVVVFKTEATSKIIFIS